MGSDRATLTLARNGRVRIDGLAKLPGGTLTVRGLGKPRPTGAGIILLVVAGSGRFAGAHGT